ncbi:hypothetical protein [Naasia lichenicola]|uniref:hypothetical protein n=1 Tax=Naasia lichenicola TaxID=2565933 RepID=UPI00130E9BBB|nr:hypothetical protein [Naasia lichenicola]
MSDSDPNGSIERLGSERSSFSIASDRRRAVGYRLRLAPDRLGGMKATAKMRGRGGTE